jgi:hypothetical protein
VSPGNPPPANKKRRHLRWQRFGVSRPDQHVDWRSDLLPANPLALIDRVRGAAGQ